MSEETNDCTKRKKIFKVLYVKLQMDAAKLEAALNEGWDIDVVTDCKEFAVYVLARFK